MTDDSTLTIHPARLRATHWLNALAVMIMTISAWRIYNAAPLFEFRFAKAITLGGWLGGALQWHFAAMWLLAAYGLVYLLFNVGSGRLWSKFLPLPPRTLLTIHRAASADAARTEPRRPATAADIRLPDEVAHADHARLQESEAHPGDFRHQHLPGGYWEVQGYNWFGGS